MTAPVLPIPTSSSRIIKSRLHNGSWVSYIEVADRNFILRYEVSLDGRPLGTLGLLIAPLSGESLWLASTDNQTWSPPVCNERDAAKFILPVRPAC